MANIKPEKPTSNFQPRRKPDWLKIKLPDLRYSDRVMNLLEHHCLNTICSSGMCPNRGECWNNGTATFMIGGDVCTRACKFCAVKTGNPHGVIDHGEVERIVDSVRKLNLQHVVITSVDRDDLPDGGASHWAALLRKLRADTPHVTVETLVPDFGGSEYALGMVLEHRPEVVSHNLETVERLTPVVRSVATFVRSLQVINRIASAGLKAKSGLMLGLGETPREVLQTMDKLLENGCSILTLGQYLQPTLRHFPVAEYITPGQFDRYREIGLQKGFRHVESGPFVRSSYHAERHVH